MQALDIIRIFIVVALQAVHSLGRGVPHLLASIQLSYRIIYYGQAEDRLGCIAVWPAVIGFVIMLGCVDLILVLRALYN